MSLNTLKNAATVALIVAAAAALPPGAYAADGHDCRCGIDYSGPYDRPNGFRLDGGSDTGENTVYSGVAQFVQPAYSSRMAAARAGAARGNPVDIAFTWVNNRLRATIGTWSGYAYGYTNASAVRRGSGYYYKSGGVYQLNVGTAWATSQGMAGAMAGETVNEYYSRMGD